MESTQKVAEDTSEAREYVATLKHDKGLFRLRVVSFNGERGAITQITAAELCPESAIIKISEVKKKKAKDSTQQKSNSSSDQIFSLFKS